MRQWLVSGNVQVSGANIHEIHTIEAPHLQARKKGIKLFLKSLPGQFWRLPLGVCGQRHTSRALTTKISSKVKVLCPEFRQRFLKEGKEGSAFPADGLGGLIVW